MSIITAKTLDKLQGLNPDERKMLEAMISEISETGDSSTLNNLWQTDYDEIPVDIDTFIESDEYIGKSTNRGNAIYPYWRTRFREMFPSGGAQSPYVEVILSGSIGVGKTSTSVWALTYILYKLLCLKNPQEYYGLSPNSRIGIVFFNITLDQSFGVAFHKIQKILQESPWFMKHGRITGNKNKVFVPDKDIDFVVGSQIGHSLGRDIFAGMMDEMEFVTGGDKNMAQSKIMKLYVSIKRRIESRYAKRGSIPGMLFMVSSKRSTDDFLENYSKLVKDDKNVLIVDEPLWRIKPAENYCGVNFKVAVGDKYLTSKILGPEDDGSEYLGQGYKMIDVPIEHKKAFELDINSALMDIAGIAISGTTKFIYANRLGLCFNRSRENPFSKPIISVSFDDKAFHIKDFFDLSKLNRKNLQRPCFAHIDTSKNGDKTGISLVSVRGKTNVFRYSNQETAETVDLIYDVVFLVAIEALKGSEIPFYKVREFFYWLRDTLRFDIKKITCDGYQSVDMLQQFRLHGFNAETLSVDRSNGPYHVFRTAINEERIELPFHALFEDEATNLEEDKIKGTIDHPVNGSKDVSDSVCGSVFNASQYDGAVDLITRNINVEKVLEALIDVSSNSSDEFKQTVNGLLGVSGKITKVVDTETSAPQDYSADAYIRSLSNSDSDDEDDEDDFTSLIGEDEDIFSFIQ